MTRRSLAQFEAELTAKERRSLARLDSPLRIQEFLDETPYSTEPIYRAPLTVLRQRKAHCFDGACFAALALARLGHPPVLIDMLPWDDDDHVLALFKRGKWLGAIAKSNFVGLRYREPVYRDLRELLLSYFEPFFNLAGNRTLRGHTQPLNLHRFDRRAWTTDDATMDAIAAGLDAAPRVTLFSKRQVAAFTKVDRWTFEANLMRADAKGLHTPEHA
jgi:hypothetical protein